MGRAGHPLAVGPPSSRSKNGGPLRDIHICIRHEMSIVVLLQLVVLVVVERSFAPFTAVGPGSASAAHHPVGRCARQGPAWSRKWQRIAHICLSNTIADMWLSACLVAHLFKTLWHHMPKETSRGRTHIKHPLPTALNARRHRQVPCWAQVFCRLHAHCIGPVTFALSSAFSTERPKALCTGAAHDP